MRGRRRRKTVRRFNGRAHLAEMPRCVSISFGHERSPTAYMVYRTVCRELMNGAFTRRIAASAPGYACSATWQWTIPRWSARADTLIAGKDYLESSRTDVSSTLTGERQQRYWWRTARPPTDDLSAATIATIRELLEDTLCSDSLSPTCCCARC